MSFRIIRCEPFIDSFCDILKGEGYILSSLEVGLDKGLKEKVLVVSSNVFIVHYLSCCWSHLWSKSATLCGYRIPQHVNAGILPKDTLKCIIRFA